MIEHIISVIFVICIFLIFIISQSRPLSNKEINKLANKRRRKLMNNYYNFSNFKYSVDKNFKSNMNSEGMFYRFTKKTEDLHTFPSVVSALLKYKKHEWVVIGFEKEKQIDLMWINKGNNNKNVNPKISNWEIVNKAKEKKLYYSITFP